jgi:hypothetical protein
MNSLLTSTASELDTAIGRYSANINQDAGFYWWKRYTYSAFWSISATPINLLITIITALTTAQTTTGALLGNSLSSSLGITALLLSVVNTFFKPYTQLTDNQALKEKWADIGIEFETIYFLPAHNDEEKRNKLVKLEENWDRVCGLKKTDDNNYFIDIIFLISKTLCIRKDIKWLPEASEAYKKELITRSQVRPTIQESSF